MSDEHDKDITECEPEASEVVAMIAEEYAWMRCQAEGVCGCRYDDWERKLTPEKRAILMHADLKRFRSYQDLRMRLLQPHGDH